MGKNALPQPEWLERAGENLARKAKVSATPRPTDDGIDRSVLLTDGNGKIEDNSARWLGKGPLPHVIEFRWDLPVVIGAARIISGWNDGNRVIAPVSSFKLQHHDGGAWRDAKPEIVDNANPAWAAPSRW